MTDAEYLAPTKRQAGRDRDAAEMTPLRLRYPTPKKD